MGVRPQKRRRDGKLVFYQDAKARDALKLLLGHLINPQICGLSYGEAVDMTLTEAIFTIEAVGISNDALAKATKAANK